jgi:SAM-dependent methyltransferase
MNNQHLSVLNPTRCAICNTFDHSIELFPANFSIEDLNPEVFSARRLPDQIHYRIVKCTGCGLVRSDPIIDQDTLADLYKKSTQTYDAEVSSLMESYARYLDRVERFGIDKGTILEIGCGSGFFLEKALERNFKEVLGIEPSQEAVAKSRPELRNRIICDMMHPGLLEPGQVDLICMFQVFDHIDNPGELLDECFKVLKPGGYFLCFNHDVEALPARILGEKSPIFDIEHTYLYSKDTIRKLFTKHGYHVIETGTGVNTYSLHYLTRLIPMSKPLKTALLAYLSTHFIGKVKISVRLGNLYSISRKE